MNRAIVGFHRDEVSDWVAQLACGHGRHVRHRPPFQEKPWVVTAEGRASRVGSELDCVRCDRREIPEGHVAHRETPRFTHETVPDALLRAHTTRRGVWARIHVVAGRLDYRIHAPFCERHVLVPGVPGVVLPEVEHAVACPEPVEFYLELWRAGQAR